VHRDGRAPQQEGPPPLSPELLRAYIAAAKQHDPFVPESLTDYVAAVYAEMRRCLLSTPGLLFAAKGCYACWLWYCVCPRGLHSSQNNSWWAS
jgi:hypothetical protein